MPDETRIDTDLVTLVPEKLFMLGRTYPLDGRVSWGPANGQYQPASAYVLRRPDHALVIDPGLKWIEEGVIGGLAALVDPDEDLKILITRPEYDCIGNVGRIVDSYSNVHVYSSLAANWFDSFDDMLTEESRSTARDAILRAPQEAEIEIVTATLRLLSTIWAYDGATKTLFTSNSFTHGTLSEPDARPVIDEESDDRTTVEDVVDHLLATHHWMRGAPLATISDGVKRVFDQWDVDRVAPGRGAALCGRTVVERHVALLLDALKTLEGAEDE